MKYAVNINCFDACSIVSLPENTVMISVNEEHEPLYPLELDRKDERILTLKFSDILAPRESQGKNINPISPDDVVSLVNFAKNNQEKNFIVHCAAGISRSSAICLYLSIVYGHKLKGDFWQKSRPNKYVLGALIVRTFQQNKENL